MTKINHLFQILGVLATVFSAYIGYLTYNNDSNYSEESRLNAIKLKVSEVVAPSGYTLNSVEIGVIKKNSYFTVKEKDTAYLFQNEKIPFSAQKGYRDRVSLLVDGRGLTVSLGGTARIPNTDCKFWLYSIEDKKYSMEVRCKE